MLTNASIPLHVINGRRKLRFSRFTSGLEERHFMRSTVVMIRTTWETRKKLYIWLPLSSWKYTCTLTTRLMMTSIEMAYNREKQTTIELVIRWLSSIFCFCVFISDNDIFWVIRVLLFMLANFNFTKWWWWWRWWTNVTDQFQINTAQSVFVFS